MSAPINGPFVSQREMGELLEFLEALNDVQKSVDTKRGDDMHIPLYLGDIEVKHPDGYTLGWFTDVIGSGEYMFTFQERSAE